MRCSFHHIIAITEIKVTFSKNPLYLKYKFLYFFPDEETLFRVETFRRGQKHRILFCIHSIYYIKLMADFWNKFQREIL